MATAKLLPSKKSWRVQVFDYKDSNGKKHYKSFSAKTKKEAEYQASLYTLNKEEKLNNPLASITLEDAINQYIDIRENPKKGKKPKSPSTITGYRKMEKRISLELLNKRLSEINEELIQEFIDHYSDSHSPKSVRNLYSLIHGALKEQRLDISRIELPDKKTIEYYIPSDNEVMQIISYCREKNDTDLYYAVQLGAYGCMRRGEICSLTSNDIDYNNSTVRINKSRVRGSDGVYVDKDGAKTESSNRIVKIPSSLVDELPKEGRIIQCTPHGITVKFNRALTTLGLPHFRFHDLRHYSASTMHAIGMPDQYIMDRGGWKTDNVMKAVYRNTLTDFQKEYSDKINNYFEGLQNKK